MSSRVRHAEASPRPSWLSSARFYEVYPQSFADSNGDGIGDLRGLTERLGYIHDLGCNALWINPCFDSPFKDAGYDVRDYTKVAPRYGTNDDLTALFEHAHTLGMHVLLDLVPGHTSEEHPWFQASSRPAPTERVTPVDADRTIPVESVTPVGQTTPRIASLFDPRRRGSDCEAIRGVVQESAIQESVSDRYIWTDSWIAGGDGLPFIGGETERDGTYIINFFKCQPALNYGFAHPKHPWQKPALGPEALATCEAMLDVMRFWLSRGADGFRVDMADSLVKHDDDGKPFTIRTWQYIFSRIRPEFPEAAFVAEWGRPYESMQAGFDMDFYLDWRWDGHPNGYNMLLRNTDTPLDHESDASYFNADSGTSIAPFLEQYLPQLHDCERASGTFNLITCNHDTLRVAQRLTERELKVAYGMLLTMPGCPFLYYGDEIGMRYRPPPTKEGGYVGTVARRCSGMPISRILASPAHHPSRYICRSIRPPMRRPLPAKPHARIHCSTGFARCWHCAPSSPHWLPMPDSTWWQRQWMAARLPTYALLRMVTRPPTHARPRIPARPLPPPPLAMMSQTEMALRAGRCS